MPKLSELGIGKEQIANVDFDKMPEQMGSFQDPPQPGPFRFLIPANLSAVWDKVETDNGNRIAAIFDANNPLLIVQSKGKKYDGEPFETRISNAERKRGKRDDANAVAVSDMDYLLRDGLGVTTRPKTNEAYAQALIQHGAGKEFGARIEWSWRCRDDKNIRVDNGQGGLTEVEQLGCGQRYYMRDVEQVLENPDDPQSGKIYPVRITCGGKDGVPCGASLRAYASLAGFTK